LKKVKKNSDTKATALLMACGISNKKGLDPIVLDIRKISGLADYFVIGSGRTEVQVNAIVQELERICEEQDISIYHTDGKENRSWVILDLGDVMVHVFLERERKYYNLESLWKAAPRVAIPEL